MPYNNFDDKIYQFHSCYKKDVFIDDFRDDERVYIKFEGVMTYSRIYLNGHYIGENKGGYLPFKLDLTEEAIPNSSNRLVVEVDSRERKDIPPFGGPLDFLTYGGIYREVSLEYCKNIHIENLAIRTKDLLSLEAKLEIDLYLHNEEKVKEKLLGQFQVLEKDGDLAYEFQQEILAKGDKKEKITVKAILDKIKLWDLDRPQLYELRFKLKKDETVIDRHGIDFGFRDLNFTNKGFYLNGKRIKLRGLNRHQSFPYVGYAMPKSAQYKDADILKYELGVNFVRLSHYPQSRHFLDR